MPFFFNNCNKKVLINLKLNTIFKLASHINQLLFLITAHPKSLTSRNNLNPLNNNGRSESRHVHYGERQVF